MEKIPNFPNWLDNLKEDSESWACNQIYMVEHLLKKRKEELSLLVIENLRFARDHSEHMERKWGVVKCSCKDNFCCNRKTYLSIIASNTQLGYRQVHLRSLRKTNVMIEGTENTYHQMMPAYKIARPIYWQDRVDAANTIQKYWRKAISNPNYVVCRNRLIHEYSGMM